MDITVILNLENVCSEKEEHKNRWKKVGENEENFLRCDYVGSRTMRIYMEELNVNLKTATDYLISLFEATDQKYSCSRVKLGKLLAIVAFKYAQNDKLIFNEAVYKYKDCGAIMYGMNAITDMSPYIRVEYFDNKQHIDLEFNDKVLSQIELPDDVKSVIEDVFRRFGAYPAKDLGCMINPILNVDGILDEDGKVKLYRFKELNASEIKEENNVSSLVKFLFDK